MSIVSVRSQEKSRRWQIWLFVAAGCLLVILGNARLVYVALRSQPACVVHTVPGEGKAIGRLSAAQSSCSPN